MGSVYSEEGTSKVLKMLPGLIEEVELSDSHPQAAELSREAAPRLGSEAASDMPHFIQRRWVVPVPPTLLSTLRSTDNHT